MEKLSTFSAWNKSNPNSSNKDNVVNNNSNSNSKTTTNIKDQNDADKILPITHQSQEILQTILNPKNKVTLIVGDTGCGKSTQIAKILLNNIEKKLTIVQPRRVAAVSLAMRVAHELDSPLGQLVGYNVRFNKLLSPQTKVVFQTDGMLIREQINDLTLSQYDFIVIDEVHERNTNTDLIIALLMDYVLKREDVKLIFMSATVETEALSKQLGIDNLVIVQNKSYANRVCYLSSNTEMDFLSDNIVKHVINCIIQIHVQERGNFGDILVFLPGQAEIDACVEIVNNLNYNFSFNKEFNYETDLEGKGEQILNVLYNKLIAFPLYGNLVYEKQLVVFDKVESTLRKVVFSTNIAETSVTIPGIKFVIDSGLVKEKTFNELKTVRCSQTSLIQRRGRAGRDIRGGVVFRLFSYDDYLAKFEFKAKPNILRENLDTVALVLKAMKVNNILNLSWLDKPSMDQWKSALVQLRRLKAIDNANNITELGKKMVKIPLDPEQACLLLNSHYNDCLYEMCIISSFYDAHSLFYYNSKEKEKDNVGKGFNMFTASSGDHFGYFLIAKGFLSKGKSKKWCKNNNLSYSTLVNCLNVSKQLYNVVSEIIMEDLDIKINKEKEYSFENYHIKSEKLSEENVIKCLAECLPHKLAIREEKKNSSRYFCYSTEAIKTETKKKTETENNGDELYIHPKSSVFNRRAEFVLFNEVNVSTKRYMTIVSRVDESVIPQDYKLKLHALRLRQNAIQ